jgi:hypothetical protein
MRIALTAALMMVATMALADEPSAPESSTEATTQVPSDTSAEQQPAATETETTAKADAKAERPFKPPAGYKMKRLNGEQVWCQKTVILGSKFPKEDCRTEAQLREIARSRSSMREDLSRGRTCTGEGCAFN